jgi:hypothetical protein
VDQWTSTKFAISAALTLMAVIPCMAQTTPATPDFKAISEEAFIYAYPMIMAYGIMYDYSVDKKSSQYKGGFNQIINEDRVYTPADTAVVSPNSDTPYSFLMMDLRSQPMVLCVPAVEKNRYYSVQLTSQYTFNYAYIGSRATGNEAGCYGVAGPNWHGETPPGLKDMFHSETEFSAAIYRTQLFNPSDMGNVRKVQAGYTVQTLSHYLRQAAPASAPKVDWLKINKSLAETNPFNYLNYILQFAPPIGDASVEIPLRQRFASIGIVAGKPFAIEALTAAQKMEMQLGIKSALVKIKNAATNLGQNENGWRVATSGFGNRAAYNGNWTIRAAAAMAGIYGNDAVEALYPITRIDNDGKPLDGSKNNYTLTFPAGQLPPVHAFWSLTMYDGKTQLLIKNPINRYLINSPMLPNLKTNADGSLTLYIQKDSPGKDKVANWLPAPNGPIYLVMRLYWPKEAALQRTWQPPAVARVN